MSQRIVYSKTSFIHVQTACVIQYSTMFEVHYAVYVRIEGASPKYCRYFGRAPASALASLAFQSMFRCQIRLTTILIA